MMRFLLPLALCFLLVACHQLDEEVFDRQPVEDFLDNSDDFVTFSGLAYEHLKGYASFFNLLYLQELQTDAMAVPTRRPEVGLFSSVFARAHRHELQASDGLVHTSWNFCYDGIRRCNQRIQIFNQKDPALAASFIAEMRVLRALYYYWLIDLYGPVAILEGQESPLDAAQASRQEVFAFIEQDILESLDDLPKTIGGTSYGKINYYTAQALLSSLYLNAEIYSGTHRYQDALEACNEIIASNGYELEVNYFSNFSIQNEASTENIFVIPYDHRFLQQFNLIQFTLHPESRWTFDLPFFPLNLTTSTSAFYDLFSAEDIRRNSFLTGPQFTSNGDVLIDSINGPNDPDGPPISFTPELLFLDSAYVQAGARIAKFEIPISPTTPFMDNDFPIFRYGEILLNKAEALWRLDPGNIEAVLLVNIIRARAGLPPLTGLTSDELLAERARELAFEGKRRTDMIRFGQFTAPRAFKPQTEPCKTLLPIPAQQLTNPFWRQNECY